MKYDIIDTSEKLENLRTTDPVSYRNLTQATFSVPTGAVKHAHETGEPLRVTIQPTPRSD